MIRFYPMARATSKLGGAPVVYDLTKISYLTAARPAYPPIVRDLETVERKLRRRNFGTRPTVELEFTIPHGRALNSSARYYEIGENLLRSPLDLSASPWGIADASIARSPERDPLGTMNAWRLTDVDPLSYGYVLQETLSGGIAARLLWYFRASSQHPTGGEAIAYSPPGNSLLAVQATGEWRCESVILPGLVSSAATFAAALYFDLDLTAIGNVDLAYPDLRSISALPGTDEEIVSDLKDKLASDDWTIDLTLNGGLTWRTVLLTEHEKGPLEEKWVGTFERFSLECAAPIFSLPALLDGRW